MEEKQNNLSLEEVAEKYFDEAAQNYADQNLLAEYKAALETYNKAGKIRQAYLRLTGHSKKIQELRQMIMTQIQTYSNVKDMSLDDMIRIVRGQNMGQELNTTSINEPTEENTKGL